MVLAWLQETGADPARLNANGGAIAPGHPLGAGGTRLMTTLVYELLSSGGRFALQTMCEAGGLADATVLEALDRSTASPRGRRRPIPQGISTSLSGRQFPRPDLPSVA